MNSSFALAYGVGSHYFRLAAVVQLGSVPLGHARVGLADQEHIRIRGPHFVEGGLSVGEVVATVCADGVNAKFRESVDRVFTRHAHHCATSGVEAERGAHREVAHRTSAFDGSGDFVEVAHRFDPQEVGAAFIETDRLFAEGVGTRCRRHRSHRLE